LRSAKEGMMGAIKTDRAEKYSESFDAAAKQYFCPRWLVVVGGT